MGGQEQRARVGAAMASTVPSETFGAVTVAAKAGDVEKLMSIVARYPAILEHDDCDALYWACKKGHLKAVDYLIARGMDMHKDSGYHDGSPSAVASHILTNPALKTLCAAAKSGDAERARLVLDRYPGLVRHENYRHETALFIACSNGRASVVELLLAHGADPHRIAPWHKKSAANVAKGDAKAVLAGAAIAVPAEGDQSHSRHGQRLAGQERLTFLSFCRGFWANAKLGFSLLRAGEELGWNSGPYVQEGLTGPKFLTGPGVRLALFLVRERGHGIRLSTDGSTELEYTGNGSGHIRLRTVCIASGEVTNTRFVRDIEFERELLREPCTAGSGSLAAAALSLILSIPLARAEHMKAGGALESPVLIRESEKCSGV